MLSARIRGKAALVAVAVAVAVTGASILPGPYASVIRQRGEDGFLETAHFAPGVSVTLRRACGNCHSNTTEWPWYSRIAPVSWAVRRDVAEGRKYLNLSRWPDYGREGQMQLLSLCRAQIQERLMPPRRYLVLHPEAKLSLQEESGLVAAFDREAARLAKAAQVGQ